MSLMTHAEQTEETRRTMTGYLEERTSKALGSDSQERGRKVWERWFHPELHYYVYGSFPTAGYYYSRDEAMEKFQQPALGLMKTGKMELDELIVDGNKAVVRYHLDGTTAIGLPYNQNYCFIYKVEDGKITEIREFLDTELVHTAVYGMDNPCAQGHTCKAAVAEAQRSSERSGPA